MKNGGTDRTATPYAVKSIENPIEKQVIKPSSID
jgi:hypothetical protein